jgi:hypothetical protein
VTANVLASALVCDSDWAITRKGGQFVALCAGTTYSVRDPKPPRTLKQTQLCGRIAPTSFPIATLISTTKDKLCSLNCCP